MIYDELGTKEVSYLNRSYVLLDGPHVNNEIVYLAADEGNRKVLVYTEKSLFDNEKAFDITAQTIKRYVFSCPPLGYMNTRYGGVYVKRTPHRAWKLGLTRENISFSEPLAGGERAAIKNLKQVFLKSYPSFTEARAMAKDTAIAFSRNYAIDHLGNLFWKGASLGNWVRPIEVPAVRDLVFHDLNLASLCNGVIRFVVKQKEREVDYESDL